MSTKQILIVTYLVIGVIFAMYGWIFGDYSHKGFFYNFGHGIIWPAIIFPSLGKAIGVIIIFLFIAYVSLTR